MQMHDSHRLFLQTFMSHYVLNGKQVKTYFKQSCERFGEVPDDSRLAEFVQTINSYIKPIHLEIKKGISEENGEHCYILVNTVESHITRLSSDYTVNELEFFKKMVQQIIENDNGSVSSIDALHLTDKLQPKMSKQCAEDMISRLERDKWVVVHLGEISLSTRAILELEQYMKEQFQDCVVMCNMCKRICLKGQLCAKCDVKLHLHCAARLFRGKSRPLCPGKNCGEVWPHEIPQQRTKEGVHTSSPHTQQRVSGSQSTPATQSQMNATQDGDHRRSKRTRRS